LDKWLIGHNKKKINFCPFQTFIPTVSKFSENIEFTFTLSTFQATQIYDLEVKLKESNDELEVSIMQRT